MHSHTHRYIYIYKYIHSIHIYIYTHIHTFTYLYPHIGFNISPAVRWSGFRTAGPTSWSTWLQRSGISVLGVSVGGFRKKHGENHGKTIGKSWENHRKSWGQYMRVSIVMGGIQRWMVKKIGNPSHKNGWLGVAPWLSIPPMRHEGFPAPNPLRCCSAICKKLSVLKCSRCLGSVWIGK